MHIYFAISMGPKMYLIISMKVNSFRLTCTSDFKGRNILWINVGRGKFDESFD